MTKILIIEDDDAARHSIRRTLERNGYEVIVTPDGQIALNVIEQQTPDAVLTDIFMPEMDGLEFIRKIMKSKPDMPVIAMTGSIETPFLEAALQFGAVYGLYKPFKPEELLSTVQKVLPGTVTEK